MSDLKRLSVSEVTDAVLSAPSLLVICHTNPDGDAVGSASALAMIARAAGIRAGVILPDGPQSRIAFLLPPGGAETSPDGYSVLCAVDVAAPGQLGRFAELTPSIGFMIDHHGTGEPFAPFLLNPTASSAGEVVFRVYEEAIRRGAIKKDAEIARRIYGAILSDTGSFAFSNVTPETHLISAELIREIGADPHGMPADEINRNLFARATAAELACRMLTIKNLRTFADGAIAASLLTSEELRGAGIPEEDTGGAVDVPRSLEGVRVAFTVRQTADDPTAFKVSSRSNTDLDVSRVCASFGGGGHRRAAGCTVHADSPEDAFDAVRRAFEKLVSDGE